MKFYKTIRFKLTFWNSLILILVNLFFILTVNVVVTEHYRKDPIEVIMPRPKAMRFFEEFPRKDEVLEVINSFREEDLKQIRTVSVISFVVLSFLSIGGGYLIAGRMLAPIRALNQATKKINSENLHIKIIQPPVDDEIGELIGNFNQMTTRLGESFDLQKQFVENASHELKTPLGVIQTNLESALIDNKISEKEIAEYLQASLKSAKFMNKLVEDLLLLSLIGGEVKFKTVDLVQVVREAIDQVKVLADEKEVAVKFENRAGTEVRMKGNASLLQRAVMNVVENAVKYSHQGGEVKLRLSQKERQPILTVTDKGLGIPEEKLAYVFDRFFRVDKSRSRKTGGTGLGLSITRKIVDLHQGNIKIQSIEKMGTEVKIIFL